MRKILVVMLMMLTISAFGISKEEALRRAAAGTASQSIHKESIQADEEALIRTSNTIEYRRIEDHLSKIGGEMNWQQKKFNETSNKEERTRILERIKELDKEYDTVLKELQDFVEKL